MDASGAKVGIVAPAFPGTGRTTRKQVQRVDGKSIRDASYGADEPNLMRLFEQSRFSVVHVDLELVRTGAESIKQHIEEAVDNDPTLVIFDAVENVHLATIADGAALLDTDVLYVGSGGLAKHISLPESSSKSEVPPRMTGDVLGIVGSINEQTLLQLSEIPDERIIKIDPIKALIDPETTALETNDRLVNKMKRDGWVILTAAVDEDDISRTIEATNTLNTDSQLESSLNTTVVDPGERIAQALALTTEKTMSKATVSGLFLTGGDIARTTLDILNASNLCLTESSIAEGIPEGWIVDGPATETRVVTKAGGFGSAKAIIKCIDHLGATDDQE
jgi:uncharacterized protein YgbK (DUF1537 family)